jgi:hypothetical protein
VGNEDVPLVVEDEVDVLAGVTVATAGAEEAPVVPVKSSEPVGDVELAGTELGTPLDPLLLEPDPVQRP